MWRMIHDITVTKTNKCLTKISSKRAEKCPWVHLCWNILCWVLSTKLDQSRKNRWYAKLSQETYPRIFTVLGGKLIAWILKEVDNGEIDKTSRFCLVDEKCISGSDRRHFRLGAKCAGTFSLFQIEQFYWIPKKISKFFLNLWKSAFKKKKKTAINQ